MSVLINNHLYEFAQKDNDGLTGISLPIFQFLNHKHVKQGGCSVIKINKEEAVMVQPHPFTNSSPNFE